MQIDSGGKHGRKQAFSGIKALDSRLHLWRISLHSRAGDMMTHIIGHGLQGKVSQPDDPLSNFLDEEMERIDDRDICPTLQIVEEIVRVAAD